MPKKIKCGYCKKEFISVWGAEYCSKECRIKIKKAYTREWRKNNRELSNRLQKEWREKNKDKVKEQNRKLYIKKRGVRLCRVCGAEIPYGSKRNRYCSSDCAKKIQNKRINENNVYISLFGGRVRSYVGKENKKEALNQVKSIRDKILDDCIKNPRKYLGK